MAIRGIRGATTVSADEPDLILEATRELLEAILEANASMKPDDVASALFTVTDDLASHLPRRLPAEMGWGLVPMMCARESLPCQAVCARSFAYWCIERKCRKVK
ncbi:MAG: chorismate mutase [Anaerolineales bacterium]